MGFAGDTGKSPEISFLDVLLTIRPNGTYSTELYIKPMTAPIIMHFCSGHAMSIKKGTLKSQIKRAMRLSSDPESRDRSLHKISELFQVNEYPVSLINRTIKSCSRQKTQKTPKNPSNLFYIKLPYIDEQLSKRVTAAIRASKAPIKVSWSNDNT